MSHSLKFVRQELIITETFYFKVSTNSWPSELFITDGANRYYKLINVKEKSDTDLGDIKIR